jgi:hypothetical protein
LISRTSPTKIVKVCIVTGHREGLRSACRLGFINHDGVIFKVCVGRVDPPA